MKKGSTSLLKAAVVLMGVPVMALAILLFVQLGTLAFEEAMDGATLGFIVLGLLAIIYISMIPYYAALFQAFKLLTYIDHNQAFSELSVEALKKIKRYAFIISGLYVIALPLIAAIAQWDDAPGLMIVGMVPVFAAFVIAIFAAVLQRLLKEAIEIKAENELTV